MKMLQKEFDLMKEATRTEPPEDDAPDSAFSDWDRNLRYVLPVIEGKKAA